MSRQSACQGAAPLAQPRSSIPPLPASSSLTRRRCSARSSRAARAHRPGGVPGRGGRDAPGGEGDGTRAHLPRRLLAGPTYRQTPSGFRMCREIAAPGNRSPGATLFGATYSLLARYTSPVVSRVLVGALSNPACPRTSMRPGFQLPYQRGGEHCGEPTAAGQTMETSFTGTSSAYPTVHRASPSAIWRCRRAATDHRHK